MSDTRSLSLQAGYLVCANNLRREAKLCDIILYVQGRMGAMVGYPAHKLLLISASKYFKLLFEREDLRNYCHFPHLSEEGVFAVLDIIYGREIRKETNLDDALMAARFLQVDTAVDILECKKEEALAEARASPEPRRPSASSSEQHTKKRKITETPHKGHMSQNVPSQSPSHQSGDVKIFRNSVKTPERTVHGSQGLSFDGDQQEQSWHSQDSPFSQTEHSGAGGYQDSSSLDHDPVTPQDGATAIVKMEPDVDLTADDSEHGMPPQGYGQQENLTFAGQTFGGMKIDTTQSDGSGMLGMGDFGSQSFQGGPGQNPAGQSADLSNYEPGSRHFEAAENLTGESVFGKLQIVDPQRPYVCHICGKAFKASGNLSQHMTIHSGVRRFACDICGDAFNRSTNLRRHRLIHFKK